jgi:iron complex transport system substrate-binding protein
MAHRSGREKVLRTAVSLSPGTTEIMLASIGNVRLLGRTAADDWPEGSVNSVEVVASVKPNYERLTALKPDLIVYDAALFGKADVDKIKSLTKAEVFAIQANTIEEFTKEMYVLGSLTASEARMNDYVNRILAEIGTARAEPLTPTPKVAVILPGDGGRDYIAGKSSFVASAVEAAGGEPVGPDDSKFVLVNPEALLGMNPDVIVVSGTKQDMRGAMALLKNPRYQTLNAIKQKRVKVINEDVLIRRGARVDQLIKALHQSFTSGGGA